MSFYCLSRSLLPLRDFQIRLHYRHHVHSSRSSHRIFPFNGEQFPLTLTLSAEEQVLSQFLYTRFNFSFGLKRPVAPHTVHYFCFHTQFVVASAQDPLKLIWILAQVTPIN